MQFLTSLGLHFLRLSGYRLTDVWHSWKLVLANCDSEEAHDLRRRVDRHFLFSQLERLCAQNGVDLAIDVGAFQGSFARDLRRSGFRGVIFSCEPNPERHEELMKASRSSKDWYISTDAVGSERGEILLSVPEDGSFASALPFAESAALIFGNLVSPRREYLVRQSPLSTQIHGLERMVGADFKSMLLKSDTQGLDRQVVASMGDRLSNVKIIMVEVPVVQLYQGTGGLSEHNAFYESLGFRIAGAYPVSWTKAGEVIEFDFVYIRNSDAEELTKSRDPGISSKAQFP